MLDKWLNKLVEEYFRFLTIILLLLGVGLLAISHYFRPETLRSALLRDLGIATVVSFFVTVVIEYYSARRREADIRSGILDAILGKVIPPQVWEEIKSNILAKPVLCQNWHLQATIAREQVTLQPGGKAVERYLATGTLTYELANQISREQAVLLNHELESNIKGKDSTGIELPVFRKITCTPSKGESFECDGVQLMAKKYWTGAALSVPAILPGPPDGSLEVGLTRKEIISIPGGYTWYMNWITMKPRITIKTELPEIGFDLLVRHPNSKLLRSIIPGEAWEFPGVMLPGQSFEIVCTLK